MITLEDVLGELLGSVPDEFKTPRLLPLRLTDGRVRLPGDLPLERARVWVEGAWPTEGPTVGEFIVARGGPAAGARRQAGRRGSCPSKWRASRADGFRRVIVTPPRLDEDETKTTRPTLR